MFGIFSRKKTNAVEKVLTGSQRGIYKRIDEIRELMELLQREAPEFLKTHCWVEGWLRSQDLFLSDLLVASPVEKPVRAGTFPRPWPEVSKENAAVAAQKDVATPEYWGLPDDIVFRASCGDDTSPSPYSFRQMLNFLEASGLDLAKDEAQVAGIIAGVPFEIDGAVMQFEQVRSNGATIQWAMHAHPLKQITIKVQGTRGSEAESMLHLVEEVVNCIKNGDVEGESSDDDFGYQFSVDLHSNKQSIFGNAPFTFS